MLKKNFFVLFVFRLLKKCGNTHDKLFRVNHCKRGTGSNYFYGTSLSQKVKYFLWMNHSFKSLLEFP